MGTIRQGEGDAWYITVDAGKTADGKRIRRGVTVHGTLREARRRMQVLEQEIEDGTNKGVKMTVRQLIERYADRCAVGGRSARYVAELYSCTGTYLAGLANVALGKLTPELIDGHYADLYRQGYKPATLSAAHRRLSAALNDAVRRGDIATNPLVRVKAPKVPDTGIECPTEAEVTKLIREASEIDPQFALCLRLAAFTGARRGTLVALRWRDVDLDAGTVVFRYAHADPGKRHGGVQRKSTKANRPYAVHLDTRLVAMLDHFWRNLQRRCAAAGCEVPREAFVFSADPIGLKPWHPSTPSGFLTKLRQVVDYPYGIHSLRHFAATQMLAAGVPPREVADTMGCSLANVMNTYSHAVPSSGAAARAMSAVLAEVLDD